MTLNNSMSITPMPPAKAKGARFEHGSVLGGKTRGARVSSQWKSTLVCQIADRFDHKPPFAEIAREAMNYRRR
jgi:hypothetical protein